MQSQYDDENRERESFSWSTKVPYTYLTNAEKAALKQCLNQMLNSEIEEDRIFAVGLILMTLATEKPGSRLVCSWIPREGEYIDLKRNIYFKEFCLPDNAAKPIDTHLCHEVKSQIIEVPIPPKLAEAVMHIEKFGQRDDFKLGELLPDSTPLIWKKLNRLMPDKLLKRRKGLSSFYAWIATEISELGDKSLAYALTRFESFSSKHATYYPTYRKCHVIQIMCDAQESMFGFPVERPEYVDGYVGSHLYLQDWVLRDWLEQFYQEFPIEDNWRSYDKAKLERYRNHYAYVVWITLASNFALRYHSTHVVTPLLNEELNGLVKILDKDVSKDHPERYLPATEITKGVVRHFCEIDRLIAKRFGLQLKEHQLTLINLKQMHVESVTTERINNEVFGGTPFPSNMIRHFMASKMKERGAGQWVQILLGHRPDVIHLPHPDILFSPAGGELEQEIEAIQSKVIGLRIKPGKLRSVSGAKELLKIMVTKYGDELSTMWAMTKTQDVLYRISVHGARLAKQGGVNIFINDTHFLDFATDEDVAFTQFMSEQAVACAAKQALKIAKQNRSLQIHANEHHRAHIEHYSHACNYLSKACLASLMMPTQQSEFIQSVHCASRALIKSPSQSPERMKRLIAKLSKPHSKPINILEAHLIHEFGLSENKGEPVEMLLSLIQSVHDSAEITIYSYMLDKMQKREKMHQRKNIAQTTWATEHSKVYQPLLKMINQGIEISQLIVDEVKRYRDELYQMVKTTNEKETIKSMEYIIDGIFALMGSEPCYFGVHSKVKLKPTEKNLVWPFQYKLTLNAIAESDLSLKQQVIYRAAVTLMYKAGVRPAELPLITKRDILDCLRIASNYYARTKTRSGNRVVHFSVTLSEDEKAILQQVFDIPDPESSDSLFNEVDYRWISHTLKSVTNNHEVSPYCLRYSFANFHYLLLMGVHLPIVQEYFERKDLAFTLAELKSLWTIRGYENEAMLKALSLSLGHKDIATTMNYYICTLPLVRLYYRLKMPLLSGRESAKQLGMPVTTYHQNKKRNDKNVGLAIGTHVIPFVTTRPDLITVYWAPCKAVSKCESMNIKIQVWQNLLNDKKSRKYAVLKKEARNYGLTVKELVSALKQEITYRLLEHFSQLPQCEQQEIYEEWLSKCNPKASLTSSLSSKGFIKVRNALSLEFRVKDRKYVRQEASVSLNKNIAAALLIVTSKVGEGDLGN